ncbi:class I SAM-dependent methyltransferase [Noviherbaspirillum denitrificans]|uniref:Methyltransferase type 11 n=1 Tax=Noviherbaspirillum denitrificans TaxID=1968433 RepID=A0A254T9C4_9BURK|nr:class I SAM-dependent methyltransferase [Noviherbaspirillum denitrificans]OWW19251.1 methyltransferase type 11 [Noviherbaspirillum denitrificans]
MSESTIQQHNQKPAAVWNSGGANYERISQTIADAIEHCVTRLNPQPQERVLDIATGTGWAARRIAARGAQVTGIDLGADLIAAAKARAADEQLKIDFAVGDAESLGFENKTFDAAISTFGIMFVSKPEAAASELSRICKPGGRIALATWPADGTIAGLFKVMKPYMAAPATPAPPSPFEWGSRERVQQLLGASFDLKFETGTTVLREPSGEAVWNLFVTGYGPTRALASTLDADRLQSLKQDFIAYHEQFRSDLGIAMSREYLVTVGVRKG